MPTRYSQDNPFQREREVLGRTIERLRKDRKMTQEDLADKASINCVVFSQDRKRVCKYHSTLFD